MIAKKPFVSVIIANYNGKKYLKNCFDSLRQLTYPKNKLEFIMVDNCSTDGSVDFVKEKYPEAKIINNDVNNYCKANNLGIRKAKGKFIALLNNDVKVDKDWLSELIKVIIQDEKIGAVGSKILDRDGKIQNAGLYGLPNFYWGERGAGEEREKYSVIEEIPGLCGAAVLYRKICFEKVGLFDEDFLMYGEDVDMSLRLKKAGWKSVFVPNSIIYHEFHGTATQELSRFYIERNRLLFLAKHYPHKLSNALYGSGYFTASRDTESSGKIYSLLLEIIIKLIQYHPIEHIKDILSEIIEELKNISHYECNILQERINKKSQEYAQLFTDLEAREKQLSNFKEELNNLSHQLRLRMDEVLLKDGEIIEKGAQISSLKSELDNLANQLRQRMDEVLLKDGQIIHLKDELSGIYNSEGFRFVLYPLWAVIWNMRKLLKATKRRFSQVFWLVVTITLTPIFLFLSLSLFLEYVSWIMLSPLLKRVTAKSKIKSLEDIKISLVMPNYNGIDCLRECLPSIFAAKGFKNGENEVLIVDDASTDGSREYIRENFPQVRLMQNRRNQGFGWTCNRGVSEAKNELVVLINNDVVVTEDFLEHLVGHFKDEEVFAVTPKLYGWDRKAFAWGMHMGHFQEGYIRLWNEADTKDKEKIYQASPSIFAIGGAMVFRKRDFLWLGGFDKIYRPNCWEDIDISFRAWKRGLKVLYEPRSLMYHKGKATLTYERHKEIKNELTFTWKNITDMDILKEHLNLLPWNLYRYRGPFLKGFFWALRYLPFTLLHRFKDRRFIQSGDRKIFNRCMLHYNNFKQRGFRHSQDDEKKLLLLVTSFMPYPPTNGAKIRIYSLAKLLRDRYDILLLTLIHREDELNYLPELKKIFKEVYAIHPKSPIPNLFYPQRYKYAYSEELIKKFKEIQDSQPLDLIQIESNELLYLAEFAKYTPVIYTEHDVSILSLYKSYYQLKDGSCLSNFFDYLKRVYFHNAIYRRLDKVITLSKNDDKILRAFFPQTDFYLIPTGVDLERFSFNLKPKQSKNLIFIGHYPHYPNEDSAIYFSQKIFPLLRKNLPEAKFLLVGSEPTERVKQLSQQANVELVGFVDDVRPYLEKAAVFVNPVRISAGIKGKVLEAMSYGVPVVSTTLGAYGIEAKPEEEILLADTPEAFVGQVLRLLRDEELYSKIATGARKLVEEKYDWRKLADKLACVYDEVSYQDESPVEEISLSAQVLNRAKTAVEQIIEDSYSLPMPVNGPEELHLELTYDCNSRCIMCDLWDYHKRFPRAEKELALDEIKRFVQESKQLQNVQTVVLSGGEPFLRRDIVEVASFFSGYFPNCSLGILTNLIDTDGIIIKVREILDRFQPKTLWLGSSLDGIDGQHDKIRGNQGAFSAFQKTIERLRRELPAVNLSATFTLTPYNIDQLIPAKKFADRQGLGFFAQFAVPKQAREQFLWTDFQLREAEDNIQKIMEDLIAGRDYQTDGTLLTQLYYWSHLVRYQREPKRYYKRCVAGTRFAMFDPYGNLFFCPILKDKVIGNIREEKFDSLWTSKAARETRDFIGQGTCHCWLVCVIFPLISQLLVSGKKEIKSLPLKSEKRVSVEETSSKEIKEINREENFILNDNEYNSAEVILKSIPPGIGIGAHYQCNAKCIFCLDGKGHKNFSLEIYQDFFEKKLGEILPKAEYLNLCGFGELLLMPKVQDFLGYLNKKLPFVNKVITTNGSPLTREIAKTIIQNKYAIQISLHASNSQLHKLLTRTANFDEIINQIRYLLSIRKDKANPHISLVFIMTTLNIEDLPNFVKFASDLAVDSVVCNYLTVYTPSHLKLSCFFKQETTNRMLKEAEEIAVSLRIPITLPPKFGDNHSEKNRCSQPWNYFYVETEGSVLPCCFAGNHIGYLGQDNFHAIWNSQAYQDLRRTLSQNNLNGWCRYCYKSNSFNVNNIRSHISFRPDLQEKILR